MNSIALVNSFSCQQLGKSEERIYEVKYVRVNIKTKYTEQEVEKHTGWYARIFQDRWNTWLHRFKKVSAQLKKTTCGYVRKLLKMKIHVRKLRKKTCQLKRQLTVS